MKRLLTLVLCLWAGIAARAENLPERIDIEYTLNGSIGQGKAHETLLLRKENGVQHYAINSEASASGLLRLIKRGSIHRHSEGTIMPRKGMKPLRFTDQRGGKPAREVEFDWSGKHIIYRRKGLEIVQNLPNGTLDELSFGYHFMFTPPPGKTLVVHETDYRILQQNHYTVTRELLDTPMGKLSTIVLTKQQDQDNPSRKKIWLATAHHLLPVRIISTEKDGLEIDRIVTKIDYTPANNTTR
ncbi:DUF3108 domain-containing protein [Nitrosomonas sp.]|uniref:DUF3108 domain-containing protein n=1 Tax=Nitrosomonas sp. TaxID=42353 RepID=UPI0025D78A7D|nr:DUF3108 domain-containing protein [Nitrosomonas sp.]MCC6917382.1 DUF3108 domain-containing protein [Nitrosomonas sp.]